MSQPNKIPQAWAVGGDYNDIPKEDAGTGLASWEEGFPPETQTPLAAGGVAPRRQDMNGALNWMSSSLLWYQQGGLWQYDALEDYERGNVVLQNDSLYYCISNNGPSGTVKSPEDDSNEAYWKPIIFANGRHPDPDHLAQPAVLQVLQAVYPIGSIYASYNNTSPSTLFGFGTWAKIEGRFLLGASSTYGLGSTGGAATVTLTVNQIPAHSHSASTASAGSHTHTATTASAGAHTHTVSGTAASAGNHSHTVTVDSGGAHSHTASSNHVGEHTHSRGTMEITGYHGSEALISGGTTGSHPFGGAFYITGGQGGHIGAGVSGNSEQINFQASRSWTGATSSSGGHSHTITVNNGGTHSHTASSATTGAHTHSVSGTAASAGAHTHSMNVGSAGAHTHSVTVANTGGSQAHDNMPPYLAVNLWRRTA